MCMAMGKGYFRIESGLFLLVDKEYLNLLNEHGAISPIIRHGAADFNLRSSSRTEVRNEP